MFGLTLGLGSRAMQVLLSVPSSHKESGAISPRLWGDDWENGRDAVELEVRRLEEKSSELFKSVEERITHLK
jgi:hypothetical protein